MARPSVADKLAAARARERKARAAVARLRRAVSAGDRRRSSHLRYVLGGTLLAIAQRGDLRDAEVVADVRAYLTEHRPTGENLAILGGTPFALDVAADQKND